LDVSALKLRIRTKNQLRTAKARMTKPRMTVLTRGASS
jgi:hypothetical protein